MNRLATLLLLAVSLQGGLAAADTLDSDRDLLVTFANPVTGRVSGGIRAPYRHRQRYSVTAEARRSAARVADDYRIAEVDRWPIRSLSVYCVVYRADSEAHRDRLIVRLAADARVESVQPLQTFVTGTEVGSGYDDAYVDMQHGLATMSVSAAHRHTTGHGVRVVVIDSAVDTDHEDLRGRFRRVERFVSDGAEGGDDRGEEHGTAVASIIGANANNGAGIVGIAPAARIDLYEACWTTSEDTPAVCDSFSLARALDAAVGDPPDVVNLSLTGPGDGLLQRLLAALDEVGVIVVAAAAPEPDVENHFPASVSSVIGVASSGQPSLLASLSEGVPGEPPLIYAPGEQILVAIPGDEYAFRSGSSLAAAHVSGVVALMLSASPSLEVDDVNDTLRRSQRATTQEAWSVDACVALDLVDSRFSCL